MYVKEHELKIRNNPLEHQARREYAVGHRTGETAGHAKALQRLGFIDEQEIREMREQADAVYSHVSGDLADGNG